MKIAYGTYAMPTVPLEEAIPALAKMGYDGIEICIAPKHIGSMPEEIDAGRRANLRALLQQHALGVPALFPIGTIHLFTDDAAQHQKNLELVRECSQLARDLGMTEPPVIATGIGGKSDQWDDIKHKIVELLGDYAEVADSEGFILAGEAHCGAAVDRSERAVWLFDTVDHPRIRMHFDIVHMFLANEQIEDSVRDLIPYTAHTHITDARKHADGSFDLLLLGNGDLDSTAYMRAMKDAGWDDFITLEVSTMVWSRPDYDPYAAAAWCYAILDGAFNRAGVPRT